jgi:cytochrome o ubiquinol oxidase subunit 2
LRVQVIGYDWKWLFIYPDQGIASIGVLALPVGRPVALQLTSATVMQSFHIPALGSQIYAMGGMVTQLHLQADRSGQSLGENNMYNGGGFYQQRFTALALPPEQFDTWTAQVHSSGIALDARRLHLIALRSTRAELIAALYPGGSPDGNAYFTGATATLFPTVVTATGGAMGDAADHLRQHTPQRTQVRTQARTQERAQSADAAAGEFGGADTAKLP